LKYFTVFDLPCAAFLRNQSPPPTRLRI